MTLPVRTRIAPSPTGPLHVGNARTALFNWLFARQHNGVFIVRVEDTDVTRSDPKWERDALENFQWLGLDWDEGPTLEISKYRNIENDEIGDYGPYRQSRRGEIYKKYLEELYEEEHIYHCFCTREELEAMRQDELARGEAPRYVGRCRELAAGDIEERTSRGLPSVLRFKVPTKKMVIHDLVRGAVEFDTGLMGDTVVAKDFTHPLFHFAVVVDDFTMEISHVIRGEDHLSNAPLHILLQEALGFPTPQYAHVPLILGPDRTRLSKRHAPVGMTEYRKEYLPEAMLNFLALLGWHPDHEREILSQEELTAEFALRRVQKSAAIFNIEKLRWLNSEYIKKLALRKLVERTHEARPELEGFPEYYVQRAADTMRVRAKTLSDISDYIKEIARETPPSYPKELLRWNDMDYEQVAQSLSYIEGILEEIPDDQFKKEYLEETILPKAAQWGRSDETVRVLAGEPKPTGKGGRDRGKLLWPLRVALSGSERSVGPFELAKDLGKEKTLQWIKHALELVKK